MVATKILIQVNSAFDLYICTSLVRDRRNCFQADLLLPKELFAKLPADVRNSYDELFYFNPRVRNLFSLASIVETRRIIKWTLSHRCLYHAVVFGAYRNDITSVLASHLYGHVNLYAVKQGVDMPDARYQRYWSPQGMHDDFYYWLFGYASFHRERLIQSASDSRKSDYLFMRPVWKQDPFDRSSSVFTIGVPQNGVSDGSSFLMPDFDLMRQELRETPRQGVLIIGERTPMTPSWGKMQDTLLQELFAILLRECDGERIYVRARKNLTNSTFYSQLDPVFLEPEQYYDDQLLKLNPRLVISVKSTATKVAAYYGYLSVLLYPCLNFESAEREHLDYLFGDGAPVERVSKVDEFTQFIARDREVRQVDQEFSVHSRNLFFEQLNRKDI